jgi:hypothetical protein
MHREFAKCAKPSGDATQCRFFQWLDEAQRQQPASGNYGHTAAAAASSFIDLTAGVSTFISCMLSVVLHVRGRMAETRCGHCRPRLFDVLLLSLSLLLLV